MINGFRSKIIDPILDLFMFKKDLKMIFKWISDQINIFLLITLSNLVGLAMFLHLASIILGVSVCSILASLYPWS